MRIGCCTRLNNIRLVEQAGYDYIEPPVIDTLIPEQSEHEFNTIRKLVDQAKIVPEAFNLFMPGEINIIGDTIDFPRLTRYLANATRRANLLGGKILVFGAGKSRNIPIGYPLDKATQQLTEFLVMAGDYAAANNVVIAVEPLNRKETNSMNSIPEAISMVRRVNHPVIQLLADLFHMTQENEPIDNLLLAKSELVHIHISGPGDRHPPGTNKTYDYAPFFSALTQIGYSNRVSIECRWRDLESELQPALSYLHAIHLT